MNCWPRVGVVGIASRMGPLLLGCGFTGAPDIKTNYIRGNRDLESEQGAE
jgi:hypothetical protein